MEGKYTQIIVSAEDKLMVKPDTIIISTTITGVEDKYSFAADKGAKNVAKAKNLFKEIELKEDTIKITRLSIGEERVRVEDEINLDNRKTTETKYKLVGYRFTARVSIKLPIDDELAAKTYTAVLSSNLFSGSSISYSLEHRDEHYDKLLTKVVNKARHKADIIAEASDMKVIGIANIDYSVSRLNVSVNRYKGASYGASFMEADCCLSSNVNDIIGSDCADDIEISDNITVIFNMG